MRKPEDAKEKQKQFKEPELCVCYKNLRGIKREVET